MGKGRRCGLDHESYSEFMMVHWDGEPLLVPKFNDVGIGPLNIIYFILGPRVLKDQTQSQPFLIDQYAWQGWCPLTSRLPHPVRQTLH